MKRTKYNVGQKPQAFGHTFDSVLERGRYLVLREAEEREQIVALKVHRRYVLVNAFEDRLGQKYPKITKHRAITYTPDFEYLHNGRLVIEDAKGYWTRDSRLRWKLLAKMMPNVLRRIVKSPTEPIGYETE